MAPASQPEAAAVEEQVLCRVAAVRKGLTARGWGRQGVLAKESCGYGPHLQ